MAEIITSQLTPTQLNTTSAQRCPEHYHLTQFTYTPTDGTLYANTVLNFAFTPTTSFHGYIKVVYTVDSSHQAKPITFLQTPVEYFAINTPTTKALDLNFGQLKDTFDEHILYNIATLAVSVYHVEDGARDGGVVEEEGGHALLAEYASVVYVLKREFGVDPKRYIYSPF